MGRSRPGWETYGTRRLRERSAQIAESGALLEELPFRIGGAGSNIMEQMSAERPYSMVTMISGVVTEHHSWGLEVRLSGDEAQATVDLRFIDDDPLIWGTPTSWPAVGSHVTGLIQGYMPNGQLRVSLRTSDLLEVEP